MNDVSVLRLPEVRRRTGLGRTTIYNLVKSGSFPAPVELPGKRIAWPSDDVTDWINQLQRKVPQRAVACLKVDARKRVKSTIPDPPTPTLTSQKLGKPKPSKGGLAIPNDGSSQQSLPFE